MNCELDAFSPGSADAVRNGCKCSPSMNHSGLGVFAGRARDVDGEVAYFISFACPLHGDLHLEGRAWL